MKPYGRLSAHSVSRETLSDARFSRWTVSHETYRTEEKDKNLAVSRETFPYDAARDDQAHRHTEAI